LILFIVQDSIPVVDAINVTGEVFCVNKENKYKNHTNIYNIWRIPIYSYRTINYSTEFKTVHDVKRVFALLLKHKVVYITDIDHNYLNRFKNAIDHIWKFQTWSVGGV